MSRVYSLFMIAIIFSACSLKKPEFIQLVDFSMQNLPQAPEGYTFNPNTKQKSILTLTKNESIGKKQNNKYLLETTLLVPCLPVSDPRRNITLKVINDEDIQLNDIDTWTTPGCSTFVDGLSPESPDYPLWETAWLDVSWNSEIEKQDKEVLTKWLDSIPVESYKNYRISWTAAVGDIMVQRGVQDLLLKNGLSRIFSDLLPRLSSFDLLLGNLEGAVTKGGTKISKSYNFRFMPEVLPVLKEAGFDYFSITNNHAYDYGMQGFTDTLHNLSSNGLYTSGAGITPEHALAPVVINLNGLEYRILSIGAYPRERNGFDGNLQASVSDTRPGILWYNDDVLTAIHQYSAARGIDIVMIHGGNEWHRTTDKDQRNIYRSLIDNGVEIVFGSHPHVLQGVEIYNTGIIYYSLGNFVFNGMEEMSHAQDSIIAALGICDGKILYRGDIGVEIDGMYLKEDTSGRILKDLSTLSSGIPVP